MKNSNLIHIYMLCLSVAFSVSVYSQTSRPYCISVTTGNCNAVGGLATFAAANLAWSLNAQNEYAYRMGVCGYASPDTNGGLTFAVIDTLTGTVWAAQNPNAGTSNSSVADQFSTVGSYYCSSQVDPEYGFDFGVAGTHPTLGIPWSSVIMHFLDSIPDGSIIIMYAVSELPYTKLWAADSSMVDTLAAMGATDLRLLCDSVSYGHLPAAPYIFMTMKGNPSWGIQSVGADYSAPLTASYCYDTVATTTGISNISGKSSLQLYPNPNAGTFTLITPTQYIGNEYTIFDCLGRKVMSSVVSKETENIEIGGAENGLYTLMVGRSVLKISVLK